MEGGTVPKPGFAVTPMPESAKDGPAAGRQKCIAGDAPEILLIALARLPRSLHHAVAGLAIPFHPIELFQACGEDIRKLWHEPHIVQRIFDHLVGEGALRPVRFPRGLGEGDAEIFFHEGGEPKLRLPAESGRDHRVENILVGKFPRTSEQTQVIVRIVKENGLSLENGKELFQRKPGQRINELEIHRPAALGILTPSALDEA